MNKRKLAINLFLVFLSSVLLYSAILLFPPLIWIALVPVIILARLDSVKEIFMFSLLLSFLTVVGVYYWVASYDEKLFYFLVFYIGSFLSLFIVALSFLFSRIKNNYVIFLPALTYLLLYKVYSFFAMGEYWFNLAILQVRFSFVTQFLGEIGLLGLIIFVNTLLAFFIVYKKELGIG